MRILHTADWHLGKLFYGSYLTEEQDYVLKHQLLPLIKDEGIDAVVLSGDVYDRSLPPTEAVALFDEMATKITAELKVPFLVISGNHDSAARLSFASRLLASQGLYIAGELDRMTDPVVLDDQYGPVAFLLAPYAEPAVVRHFLGDDNLRSHEAALCALLSWQQEKIPSGMRTVCAAHAFVAGGLAGDSERPLSIGGSDQVGSDLFTDFSYTALGHLHGPQQITVPTIRYAGSLLKYSFGEARQKKALSSSTSMGPARPIPSSMNLRPVMTCASSAVLLRTSWPLPTTGLMISFWQGCRTISRSSTAWPNCGANIPTPWPLKCPTVIRKAADSGILTSDSRRDKNSLTASPRPCGPSSP